MAEQNGDVKSHQGDCQHSQVQAIYYSTQDDINTFSIGSWAVNNFVCPTQKAHGPNKTSRVTVNMRPKNRKMALLRIKRPKASR